MHSKTRQTNGSPSRTSQALTASKNEQIHQRAKHVQNSSAKETIQNLAKQKQFQMEQEPGIIDGFIENVISVFFSITYFQMRIQF